MRTLRCSLGQAWWRILVQFHTDKFLGFILVSNMFFFSRYNAPTFLSSWSSAYLFGR